MELRVRVLLVLGLAVAVLRPSMGATAVVATSDYIVGTVALPDVGNGDVAVVGTALFVGQGSFGAGSESIARIEPDGSAVTVVTGLNAVGGLAYDRATDRLIFADNGGDLSGAATGDTVYALAAPLAAAGSVAASGLSLAPAGTIPFAQAVLPLAGGSVLVGDAAGGGAGRVVKVSGGSGSNLISGLDYTAGIALTGAGVLLVGDVDSTTFVGSIGKYDLTGAPTGTLAGSLSGAYDTALDAAGNALVTGGFTGDFSSSTIVRITPVGGVTQIASGFTFSTGLDIDAATGQVVVLDIGATHLDTLTPVSGLTPGGKGRKECQVEMWGGAPDRSQSGVPKTHWTCTDGAPCDRDGTVDGVCTFLVGACFTVSDPRTPTCVPAPLDSAIVSSHQSIAELPDIQTAIDAVLPTSVAACSRGVPVVVDATGKSISIAVDGTHTGKRADKDTLRLRCLPGA